MDNVTTEKVSLKIADGTQINVYVARPSDSPKHPGLLVLQEAYGVNAHIRDVTERFAREGYVLIAPELYHRTAPGFEGKYDDIQSAMPHMKAMTEKGLIEDLRAAYDWLTNNSHVAPEKIASIGFAWAERASFLPATLPLQASISFYGGNIAPALLPESLICMRRSCFSGADSTNTSAQNRFELSWTNASVPAKRTLMSRSRMQITVFSATRGPAIIRKPQLSLGISSPRIFSFISASQTNGRDCVDNDVFDVSIFVAFLWRIVFCPIHHLKSTFLFADLCTCCASAHMQR